jgi:hypothetical protein
MLRKSFSQTNFYVTKSSLLHRILVWAFHFPTAFEEVEGEILAMW